MNPAAEPALADFTDDTPAPIEPIDERATARQLAYQAAPFHFAGRPLAPLAIGREADWLLHCHLIGLPPMATVFGTDLFVAHAVRMLWFCAHQPATWLNHPGPTPQARAITLDLKIRDWAEIHIPAGAQFAALTLAWSIYERAYTTLAHADTQPTDDSGNAPGP